MLKRPPEIAIEIVSTNWEMDYISKPAWFAAFGVEEYWIIDPLFTIERYPNRRNPKITQPTISIGRLVPSRSTIIEQEYEFDSYTGSDRIQSKFFPELDLTVEQVITVGSRLQ